MAAASMRQKKRTALRRIAAKNFLSNISLDGSQIENHFTFNFWKKAKHKPGHGECQSRPNPSSEVTQTPSFILGESIREEAVDADQKTPSPRPRAQTIAQVTNVEAVIGNEKDPVSEKTPSKRSRASTYSIESRERASIISRKRLLHLPSEKSIRENNEKSEKTSRRSSSLSGESISNDSFDREIRFLSPDSRRKIKNERVLIISGRKTPIIVTSILPYKRQQVSNTSRIEHHDDLSTSISRVRHHSGNKSISSQDDMFLLGQKIQRGDDGQDISYSDLLEPSSRRKELKRTSSDTRLTDGHSGRTYTRSVSEDPRLLSPRGPQGTLGLERVVEEEDEHQYDPSELDDPELQSGGYRTVLTFSSYMTSVIDYVKPSTLKKELNEKFREKFPNVHLSLTKFRSLKKELRAIGHVKCNVDLWTIAQAYVFFEKLILKLLISKQNRKLCAGACLMLSAKLNDIKGQQLEKLIDEIEDDFRLHRKEMLAYEFATLVALEFSLLVPDAEIYPHYQRLLYQS